MQIEYYKDNGGRYHWRLIGEDGVVQAVSAAEFLTLNSYVPESRWADVSIF